MLGMVKNGNMMKSANAMKLNHALVNGKPLNMHIW